MAGRRLAQGHGRCRSDERRRRDLIEQHLDGIGAPQRRRPDEDGRCGPERRGQERETIAECAAARRPARHAPGHAEEGERQAHPLERPEPLAPEDQRRPERHEEGRGVDEHGRPRRRRVAQRFVEDDEFGREQHPGQRPRRLRAVDPEDPTLRRQRVGDHADDADRGTDSRLRDRADLGQRDLGDDLVEAPHDAQRGRQGGGEGVEGAGSHPSRPRSARQKSRAAGHSWDPPP